MSGATHDGQISLVSQRLKSVAVGKSWVATRAWPAIRRFLVTKPLGAVGGGVILLMVLTALFANVLAPYNPYQINQRLQLID
jgi:hypothetical protein